MEKETKSISYEGADQVGKGDAVSNLAEHFSQLGLEVEVIQFPYYATPIGYLVRDMLLNNFPEGLDIDDDREMDIRLALFSLNRLEILNCIEALDIPDVYIFDRGPYSCSLTIAYEMLERGIESEEYIRNALGKGIQFDSYFLNFLNIDNCVVCLKHSGIDWKASRGAGEDMYEKISVQKLSEKVYSLIEERVGEGWINVVTKNSRGWKSREEICNKVISFIHKRGFDIPKGGKKRRGPNYLGIDGVREDMYIGSVVDDKLKSRWDLAIRSNNKKEVYVLGKDISEALVKTTELIKWNDEGLSFFFKDILEELPEICYIIENRYGKNILNKLVKSLK